MDTLATPDEKHDRDRRRPVRRRWLVFGATLVLAGVVIGLFEGAGPEPDPMPDIVDLALPERTPPQVMADDLQAPQPEAEEPWQSVTVRRGQTLDAIFRQVVAALHQAGAAGSAVALLEGPELGHHRRQSVAFGGKPV